MIPSGVKHDCPNLPPLPGAALPSPLSVGAETYGRACAAAGIPGGLAGAIERYKRFYRNGVATERHVSAGLPPVTRVHESPSSEGVVRKFTLAVATADAAGRVDLSAGKSLETESVIIPMIGRKGVLTHTLCVSSQVGCAMGCVFCQTAQMGLIRSLTAGEIVQQWWIARHAVGGYGHVPPSTATPPTGPGSNGCGSITNLVFMGMGEPMDNLDAVIDAIAIITDHNGAGLPMSKVTISTVGRLDGIARLAEQVRTPGWHRLNLAISVNAPNDRVRSQIMPVNRAMPMSDLRRALENWPIYGAAKLCLEYVLIPGVNDAREHAVELGDWVLGRGVYAGRPALPGLVNVIPYNPRDNSPWPAPDESRVDEFLGWLLETGVYAKRRRTKGRDTMAACGQLGNPELKRRRVPLTCSSGRSGDKPPAC